MQRHERSFRISGRVLNSQNREASDAVVRVLWQRLRGAVQLAEVHADEEGRYEAHYRVPDDAPGKVLIVVEASGGGLRDVLRSALTKAADGLVINLTEQPEDTSAYAMLLGAITPLLEHVPITALVEDDAHHDLTFLSQETGRSAEQIMQLCVSARLAEAHGIAAPCFYAFLVQRIPANLPRSLLDASQEFSLIDALLAQVAQLIANQQAETQLAALKSAIAGTSSRRSHSEICRRWCSSCSRCGRARCWARLTLRARRA
jgi:hypothetical protein